jgi:hypothetical protein
MNYYGIYKNGDKSHRDVVEAEDEKSALRVFGQRTGLINTGAYRAYEHQKGVRVPDTRQFQITIIEDAITEIIDHPLTPKLDDGAQLRFKNIILRHLARMV